MPKYTQPYVYELTGDCLHVVDLDVAADGNGFLYYLLYQLVLRTLDPGLIINNHEIQIS